MKLDNLFTIRARTGMISTPEYFTSLYEENRQQEINFWFKGRKPIEPNMTPRTLSQEQIQKEANEARKAKRALQKAKVV